MKKVIMTVAAMCSFMAFAASEYMVYDFTMKAKTTKAKGVVETACGDEYVYREGPNSMIIRGVIAGCGCPSILANGSCDNALILLWNEATQKQITNYTFSTWIVQRIGKHGEKVEHMAKIECEDFEVTLAGIGTYRNDRININGAKFAGTAKAPYLVTKGSCSACVVTPDTEDQSSAVAPCEDGVCTDADNSDITPFYGDYTLTYNTKKSKKTSKTGISAKNLGVPAYVNVDAGFFD